jgi:two-component system cell cycle response regulator CtrA
MRVLLIEDEPNTAKAIELMLAAEGFNVYSTDLGEEGLDLGKLYCPSSEHLAQLAA